MLRDIGAFIAAQRQPTEITDEQPGDYDERVMMGLRLAEGIPEELYKPFEKALKLIPGEYYRLGQAVPYRKGISGLQLYSVAFAGAQGGIICEKCAEKTAKSPTKPG